MATERTMDGETESGDPAPLAINGRVIDEDGNVTSHSTGGGGGGGGGGQSWGTVTTGKTADYTLGPDELVEVTADGHSISLDESSFSEGDMAAVVANADSISVTVGASSSFNGSADIQVELESGTGLDSRAFAIVYYDGTDFGVSESHHADLRDVSDVNLDTLFVAGTSSDEVNSYALSTAGTVNSGSASNVHDIAEDSDPEDVFWDDNLSTLFVLGAGSQRILAYNCDTHGDISTASDTPDAQFDLSSQVGSNITGATWMDNGHSLLVLDNGDDTIHWWTTPVAYSLDDDHLNYRQFSLDISGSGGNKHGLSTNKADTRLYLVYHDGQIGQYNMSTAADLSEASTSPDKTFDFSSETSHGEDWWLDPAGDDAYLLATGSDEVYHYDLSTADEIDSASYASDKLSVGTEDDQPRGIAFGT